jgi:hypothetical protein
MTKGLLTTAFFVRHDHVKPAEQIGRDGRTNYVNDKSNGGTFLGLSLATQDNIGTILLISIPGYLIWALFINA